MTAPRFFPVDNDHTGRAFVATGMCFFALLLALAPAAYFDERLLNGVSAWAKPLKFALALGVHFLTLAALAQLLAPKARNGVAMRLGVWAILAAGLFEIVYIAIQAARGRHSHFNYDTQFESIMYIAMGLGALVLVLVPLMMGVRLATQREGTRSGLRLGAVLGLVIGPILTIAFAGYMSMSGSHFVGAEGASDAGGVPVFGWSRDYADLRPAHFAATHLIQALPIIGYLGDRIAPPLARAGAILAAAFMAGGAIWLFTLALSGAAPLGFLK